MNHNWAIDLNTYFQLKLKLKWKIFDNICEIFVNSGSSKMPIIHFLMEFRLRPLSGLGEDWVSLVIPFNPNTNIQSYLLRGLTSGINSIFENEFPLQSHRCFNSTLSGIESSFFFKFWISSWCIHLPFSWPD